MTLGFQLREDKELQSLKERIWNALFLCTLPEHIFHYLKSSHPTEYILPFVVIPPLCGPMN